MRTPLFFLALLSVLAGAAAEDLAFLDGKVWLDTKVITREATYVIVKYDGGIHTVHAAELHPGTATQLKIRPPTDEEIAAQEAADAVQREAAEARRQRAAEEERAALQRAAEVQAARAAAPRPPVQVVTEPCSVVYAPRPARITPPAVTRLQGRVVARLSAGAIVQGEGMPQQPFGDFGWVQGLCYIHQTSQLNATSAGTPISGKVIPAGDYRYTDSQGVVHVLRAWRL